MLNGQTKMVSNEVSHQNAASVAKSAATNSANAVTDQQVSPQGLNSNNRTQDDARVSYHDVYQRQNDADYQPYPKSSRWFGTEDANLIDVRQDRLFAYYINSNRFFY